jgi:hypothetical protein
MNEFAAKLIIVSHKTIICLLTHPCRFVTIKIKTTIFCHGRLRHVHEIQWKPLNVITDNVINWFM